MIKENLQQIVKFRPAFDKRDPNPSKNYGVGAVIVFMVLKGEKGAVHFNFGTGMYLPSVYEHWESKGLHQDPNKPDHMGYDVGYCALEPDSEWQKEYGPRKNCDWLDGRDCYGDGSAMRAGKWMNIFVREGGDKIWEMLEEYYYEQFYGGGNDKAV